MNLPKEEWGVTCSPLKPVAGALEGECLLAEGWEWATKEGGALGWTFGSDGICNVSAVWCTLGSP